MEKVIYSIIVVVSALFFLGAPVLADDLPVISGRAHVQDVGWTDASEGNNHLLLGTTGQGKRIEAYVLDTNYPGLGLQYQAHVQDIGWQDPVGNGQMSGTEGQARRIEAFRIQLTGAAAPSFTLYYRTHVENYGWLDWTSAGQSAGTTNHAYRCEAIEFLVLPAGTPAPGNTRTPAVEASNREEAAFIYQVNRLRARNGLSYVTGDATLRAVACVRAPELVSSFSHIRPNGQLFETAVKDAFPNYPFPGGGFTEVLTFGATNLAEPVKSFEVMTIYPHDQVKFLDPDMRYVAWASTRSQQMGYAVALFSGLDRIDFADY